MTSKEDKISMDTIELTSDSTIVTQDKESPEYLEKLNQYYSIKHNYEVKKQEKINRIIKNPELSLKQKQEAYSKVKMNCMNCGRRVGTIFENNDGILSAICGDKTNPCTLNIKINTGKFVPLDELISAFQTGVDDSKTDIITTKLDLLFGYESESTVLHMFKKIKKELSDDLETLIMYRSKFIKVIENLDNKTEIKIKLDLYYDKIELIKNTIDEFNESGQINLIKDMIVVYQDELMPIINDLNILKYKYYAMEFNENNNTHHLIKKQYTISQLLDTFVEPVVDTFEINKTGVNSETVNMDELRNMGRRLQVDDFDWGDDEEKSKQESKQESKETIPKIKRIVNDKNGQYGNKDVIMFGDKIIVNENDYEVNQGIIENNKKISIEASNNKEKYQQEMIYVAPSHPELVAIDKNTGEIFVVDLITMPKYPSPIDVPSPGTPEGYPSGSSEGYPSGTPPPPPGTPESVSSTSPIESPPAHLLNKGIIADDEDNNIGD